MHIEEIIRQLGLEPHPEGGHYREVHRSAFRVPHPGNGSVRSGATHIYFLLKAGEFSAFHRVQSEETWHLYDGGPMELWLIHPSGVGESVTLGRDLTRSEQLSHVVPAGCWQAARPAPDAEFALCGCTVVPGFDFADFEMPTRADLQGHFPQHHHLIEELTRAGDPALLKST